MVYYLTPKGLKSIQKKIGDLERKLKSLQGQTKDTVESGSSSGDGTHDNPAYDDLKQKIRVLDEQLRDLHRITNGSQILDYPSNVDAVCYGSQVTLRMNGEQYTYQIVGYGETDIEQNRISYDTPLAQAIIGSKAKEKKKCQIGDRDTEIEIINVSPLEQSLEERL